MKEKMGESAGIKSDGAKDYQRKIVTEVSEKEFFDMIKNNKDRILAHFFNSSFQKC